MPFTVAHAAAALPLRRLKLVWSAFLVGSMAPDFPYVIGSTTYRSLGHEFPGLLEFTLPASLAALWLYHNVVKRPVIELLPIRLQQRLPGVNDRFAFGGISRFLAILGSIILGIATHLIWDSFTHQFTWPWYRFAWMRTWMRLPIRGWVPTYSVLQYASTILGLIAIGIWCWLWYRHAELARPEPWAHGLKSRFPLALAMFAAAALVGVVRAKIMIAAPLTISNLDVFLLTSGVTFLALAFWELLLYCILVSSHQVWIIP